ncbi:MAG: AMP-dependent synthetase, partial [Desulfobacteraceae bacterium]
MKKKILQDIPQVSDSPDAIFSCSSLVELLSLRALQHPNKRAYAFLANGENEEAYLTYGELDRRAKAIGAWLQSQGAAGERVLLLYPAGLEYVCAFFGCLYAGAIAVPSYPPRLNRPDSRLQAIVTDAQAVIALTTANILSSMERRFVQMPELGALRWTATDTL